MSEPFIATFKKPGQDDLCSMALSLDTNPETAVERMTSDSMALRLAMTMTRGPGSYVSKNARSVNNVLDYPLDDDSRWSISVMRESDAITETTRFGQLTMNDRGQRRYIVRCGKMTTDEAVMTTQNLVTRFIACWQHLAVEQLIVMSQAGVHSDHVETPEQIAEHARGHLDDLLRMYRFDASSDVVTVSFDRTVVINGHAMNFTMIERVFDTRVSSSLNEAARAAQQSVTRHSTIRAAGSDRIITAMD